jgi:hypothetical protein
MTCDVSSAFVPQELSMSNTHVGDTVVVIAQHKKELYDGLKEPRFRSFPAHLHLDDSMPWQNSTPWQPRARASVLVHGP